MFFHKKVFFNYLSQQVYTLQQNRGLIRLNTNVQWKYTKKCLVSIRHYFIQCWGSFSSHIGIYRVFFLLFRLGIKLTKREISRGFWSLGLLDTIFVRIRETEKLRIRILNAAFIAPLPFAHLIRRLRIPDSSNLFLAANRSRAFCCSINNP